MNRFNTKYYQESKYKVSENVFDSSKSAASFINKIRQEANMRQIVIVDHKVVIFGIEGLIVLPYGKFWSISAQVQDGMWGKHLVLVSPDLKTIIKKGKSFLRLDSGCISGMLGDITCDCIEQLRIAQKRALKNGGVIIYIPEQDGRGWKEFKMAHQRIIHETKLDTITVAKEFYGSEGLIDIRTFDESTLILKALGFPKGYKFNLGTKNPQKMNTLLKAGFNIVPYPIKVSGASKYFIKNLKAKEEFFNNQKEDVYASDKER